MENVMGMSIPGPTVATQASGVSYIRQQQMKDQMQTLMSSVQSPAAEPVSKPVGNIGNNVNTVA